MPVFAPLVRRAFLALALLAPFGLGGAPARAAGDVYVHAGANFTPVTIAVTPLAGDAGDVKVGAVLVNDFAHSMFLTPINPTELSRRRRPIRTCGRTSTPGRRSTRNSC